MTFLTYKFCNKTLQDLLMKSYMYLGFIQAFKLHVNLTYLTKYRFTLLLEHYTQVQRFDHTVGPVDGT